MCCCIIAADVVAARCPRRCPRPCPEQSLRASDKWHKPVMCVNYYLSMAVLLACAPGSESSLYQFLPHIHSGGARARPCSNDCERLNSCVQHFFSQINIQNIAGSTRTQGRSVRAFIIRGRHHLHQVHVYHTSLPALFASGYFAALVFSLALENFWLAGYSVLPLFVSYYNIDTTTAVSLKTYIHTCCSE